LKNVKQMVPSAYILFIFNGWCLHIFHCMKKNLSDTFLLPQNVTKSSSTWNVKLLVRMSACRIHLSYYSNPIGVYVKKTYICSLQPSWMEVIVTGHNFESIQGIRKFFFSCSGIYADATTCKGQHRPQTIINSKTDDTIR
jgi:hypothetical protein